MSEWISVEDRLPEEVVLVNVVRRQGGVASAYINLCGLWATPENGYICRGKNTVTHWQPLPEPPKPKGPFSIYKGEFDRLYLAKCDSVGPGFSKDTSADDALRFSDWLNEMWKEHKCK